MLLRIHMLMPTDDLIPYQLNGNINHGTISWIKTGIKNFTEPFFTDTIKKLKEQSAEELVTGAEALLKMNRGDDVLPAGFIFHVSRCGSTLLSNAARNINGTIVISEADTFNHVLVSLLKNENDPKTGEAIFRALVNCYGMNNSGKLFIKFSSWNAILIDWIQNLYPSTPIVFAFREPFAVVNSLLNKQPGWFNFFRDEFIRKRFSGNDASFMRFVLNFLHQVYTSATVKKENMIYLDYNNNKLKNIGAMLHHFHLHPSEAEWKNIEAASNIYSKDRKGEQPFLPVRETRFSVPENIAKDVTEMIMPKYELLKSFPDHLFTP